MGEKGASNISRGKRTGLRLMIAALGAALLLGGLWRGEYMVTLNKAIHVCLECIGIG